MEHKRIFNEWVDSLHVIEEDKQILVAMSDYEICEAFYKYAEFGTAGMRGIMGMGTNRLNKYTIRMASKGLADMLGADAKVAIAYDTRNHSAEFAEEAAKVLAAAGINVFLFDRVSPVPLLSFAVRELGCDGGIVITASHNTKEYNGFKVYDSTGSQMGEAMADEIAGNIAKIEDKLNIPATDINDEKISIIGKEIIDKFTAAALECGQAVDEKACADLNIIYTSLHGSGRDYVLEVLDKAGFTNVTLIEEQADFNGDFPTVKKPNPEDKAAFAIAEKYAIEQNADIIIGTDPDCDRIGVGVRTEKGFEYLTGNQAGVLLIDYLAATGSAEGKTMITTIVTSDMGAKVAQSYGADVVRTFTGFKNIGAVMNELSEEQFLMGYEESYGYLTGMHARDKDGVSTALVIAQMATYWKAKGKTLVDALSALYTKHGYWIDEQESFTFEGSQGVTVMAGIMGELRNCKESAFDRIEQVDRFLDYKLGIDGFAPANVLKYIFENGSWLAVRPSGTEPKIKFYYCINGSDKASADKLYEKLRDEVRGIIDER